MKFFYNKFSNVNEKDIIKILFIISMFFSLLIGVSLVYSFDFTSNFNLLFDSDTSRVINDMTTIEYNHYRLKVHPLFVILTEPIYFLIKGLVINKMLTLIIISSIVTSLTIIFIYKLLSIYSGNKKIKCLICLCYLFSFSNYIYTAGIEIYNIAVLFLVVFWYYILKKVKYNKFDKYSYFIMSILGVLSMAFTITNGIIFLIILFSLLIYKKVKFRYLLIIFISSMIMLIMGIGFQKIVWHNTPMLTSKNYNEEENYINYNINLKSVKNVIKNDYYNSILSTDIYLNKIGSNKCTGENCIISFNKINILNIVILTIFYIFFVILLVKNFKYNLFANTGIILALLFNTSLHILYGNNSTFLYSLHFLYLIFINIGINLSLERNIIIKKISTIIFSIVLTLELILNSLYFTKIIKITKNVLSSNFYVSSLGILKSTILTIILIFLVGFLIYFIIKFFKKIKKSKNMDVKVTYTIITAGLCLIISCIFIALETIPIYKKFLWKRMESKTIENLVIDYEDSEDKDELYKNYKEEIKSLSEYKIEYEKFLKEYDHKKVDYLNNSSYYFFGLGNRTKLLYKEGKLINLDNNESIYEFDIKSHEVIPNMYTVILQTKDDRFIKILEDDEGIHIISDDGDIIIDGTDNYIDLFEFKNQKYKNIKKVLYSEILFNIKDSVIYPNILVYDNPWYRDAALACMVLKETNNLELINNWVNQIDKIYDLQNKGNKEADNLGELLYILSTQENINYELVDKIEKEAKSIAKKNPDGYYIYGTTDFSNRYLYQNLWYKLGIESVGKKFKFKLPDLNDEYSNMAWWQDYDSSKKIKNIFFEDYPYLTIASYHNTKEGSLPLNDKIYPLSWEKNASEANYNNINILGEYYSKSKISPLHTWTASELLLLLLDDTNNLR